MPDCAAAFEAIEQQRPDFAGRQIGVLAIAMLSPVSLTAWTSHRYSILGTPIKRERDTVRHHFSAAFSADTMLTLLNDDELSNLPTSEEQQLDIQ